MNESKDCTCAICKKGRFKVTMVMAVPYFYYDENPGRDGTVRCRECSYASSFWTNRIEDIFDEIEQKYGI